MTRLPVLPIKYDFDNALLLDIFHAHKGNYGYHVAKNLITPSRLDGEPEPKKLDGFKVIFQDNKRLPELDEIGLQFCEHFGIEGCRWLLTFIYLEPNAILPWHIDTRNQLAAVNHVLTEGAAGVTYEDGVYEYQTALLDVRRLHMVANNDRHRIVLRFTFFEPDTVYGQLYDIFSRHAP